MSSFESIAPPWHLRQWVQFFWTFEGFFPNIARYQQRTSASVFPKLAFQYEQGMIWESHKKDRIEIFRSGFQGQTDRYDNLVGSGKIGIIGVSLYPQAIPLLFGVSAHEMLNAKREISEVLGDEGKTLEERIVTAPNNEQRMGILCNYLETKIVKLPHDNPLITSSIHAILNQCGEIRIDALVASYAVSQRQFERRFKDLTGFSAKKFSRIVRFETGMAQAFQISKSLTQLSHDLGYTDQSHFIKEFREFTGLSPKKYFSEDFSIFRK